MILWLTAALAGPFLQPADPWQDCLDSVVEPVHATAPSTPQGVALVVGVACHRDRSIAPLAYADDDAVRMTEALRARQFAVTTLTGEVTTERFREAVDALLLAHEGMPVLVYFSGHGVLADTPSGLQRHLVFSDTSLDALTTTALPAATLEGQLSSSDAPHRVLVQDTCFAANAEAGGKSLGAPGGAKGLQLPALPTREGDVRMYASRFYQLAVEQPELRGSLYTTRLVEALSSSVADQDGDACVGLWEAHAHATEQVHAARLGMQTPVLLAHRPAPAIGTQSCTPKRATHGVLLRTTDSLMVQVDGVAPEDPRITPGRHALRIDGQLGWSGESVRLLDSAVRVRAGQWLDPDAIVRARAPYALVEAGVDVHPASTVLPTAGVVAGLWYVGRAVRPHRLAAGLQLGLQPAALVGDTRFLAGHASARAAVLWPLFRAERRSVDIGPAISAGVRGRTPTPMRESGPSTRFPTQWSPAGGLGLRVQWVHDRLSLALDAEGSLVPLDGRAVVSPRLTATFGVRP